MKFYLCHGDTSQPAKKTERTSETKNKATQQQWSTHGIVCIEIGCSEEILECRKTLLSNNVYTMEINFSPWLNKKIDSVQHLFERTGDRITCRLRTSVKFFNYEFFSEVFVYARCDSPHRKIYANTL